MSNEQIKNERAKQHQGALFEVNDGLIEIIQYNGNKRVLVRFVESGYTTWTTMMNIKAKQVKDKFKPSVCGVITWKKGYDTIGDALVNCKENR